MNDNEAAATCAIIDNTMVVSVQNDLAVRQVQLLQDKLLNMLLHRPTRGVLLDLSEVGSLDITGYEALLNMSRALKIMGAKTLLVGMRPGVVLGLSLLDADLSAFEGVIDIEQGLIRFKAEASEPVE